MPAFEFAAGSTRRSFLAGTAAAGLAAGAAHAASAPGQTLPFKALKDQNTAPADPIRYSHLRFEDPAEKFAIKTRLEFGLEERTYVWWYTFVLFALLPDRSPIRLVRFEGMEMSAWRKGEANDYIVHGHNVSFPQDYETGAYIDSWTNPVTGQTLATQPTLLTSDPGRRKTPEGDYDLSNEAAGVRQENAVFRLEGDLIHKDDIRNPPENWPGQFVETNTVSGALEGLIDTDRPSVPARGSGMWVQPFLSWMKMPKTAGPMVGYFSGRKLEGAHQLPAAFQDRLTRRHPELAQVDPTKFTGEYWKTNAAGLLNVD